jgi:hypothetical protein
LSAVIDCLPAFIHSVTHHIFLGTCSFPGFIHLLRCLTFFKRSLFTRNCLLIWLLIRTVQIFLPLRLK